MPLEKQAEFLFNKENYWEIKNVMIQKFTQKLASLPNLNQSADYLIKLIKSVPGTMKLIDPKLLSNDAIFNEIKNKDNQAFQYLVRARNRTKVG